MSGPKELRTGIWLPIDTQGEMHNLVHLVPFGGGGVENNFWPKSEKCSKWHGMSRNGTKWKRDFLKVAQKCINWPENHVRVGGGGFHWQQRTNTTGGSRGPGPPAPKIFSKSCSFQAILSKYWPQGSRGVKTPLAPLTKILDPPLDTPKPRRVFFATPWQGAAKITPSWWPSRTKQILGFSLWTFPPASPMSCNENTNYFT